MWEMRAVLVTLFDSNHDGVEHMFALQYTDFNFDERGSMLTRCAGRKCCVAAMYFTTFCDLDKGTWER
jgi:hypothetical protein